MPLLFWIEVGAYAFAAVGALTVAMVALGSGPRRALNRLLAVFATLAAIWCASAVLLRFLLWLERGHPAFWLELATVALGAAGVLMPLFAVRYVGRSPRRADFLAGLGLLAVVGLSIPLFNHRLLVNPVLTLDGVGTYHMVGAGMMAFAVPIPYVIWSFVVLWQDRGRVPTSCFAVSALTLLAGLVLGGMLRPLLPTPVLALSASAAIAPMAYGVVTKQLLNPLRELNDDLRQQVQERSRELTETTRQLEDAHAALEDRGAQLRTAAQIAREAAAIHDVQRLLDETVHLISDRFHFYHAGIFLLDKGHEWAILRAASSDGGQRMLVRGHQLRSDQEGIVGYVTGRGEPRIALDVGADAVFFDNPDLPETRSEMALPLEARGEIIGALDVQSREPGAFTNEDVEVLQTLADQVAIAISNAHLFEQAQEALEAERQAYGEFSRRAWQRLQAAGQPSRSCFDPHGVLSGSEEWRDDMRQAAREGRPIRGYKLPDAVGGKGASETLAVPIKVRGNVIGALDARKSADGESRSDPWTPDEIALMQSLCQQLGAALESARLHQDVQRQAARERLVSDVASQMRESLDLTTVLRSGAEGIREAMDLRAVTVRLRDGGGRKEAENS